MKRRKQAAILSVTILFSAAGSMLSEVLTFDDVNPPGAYVYGFPIWYNYGGLEWNNWYVANIPLYFKDFGVGGGAYPNAVVSGNWVAYTGGGSISVSVGAFNLNSVYMTAAWNDGLQVEAQGFIGNSLVYDNSYNVNTFGPTFLALNYVGVTEVNFISSGGIPNPTYSGGGGGTQFAIDNLSATMVPEPSTLSLIGLTVMVRLYRFGKFLRVRFETIDRNMPSANTTW